MHIVIAGANGQLGSALRTQLAARTDVTMTAWELPDFDITQPTISRTLAELGPDVVINAAAWTNVDGAEAQPDAAYAVNTLGPAYLAEGCARCSALFVHVSTNEVFTGVYGRFYREYDDYDTVSDNGNVRSVYARSKLAAERAVLQHHRRAMIVRLAWLFGPGGNNFPTKIMAAADKLGALDVVDDEFGNPTYAPDAAAAIVALMGQDRPGIYHVVNDGFASRFEFARHVLNASGRSHIPITPISVDDWERAAQPPRHAVLVNQTAAALGITLRPWQAAVEAYLRAENIEIIHV
jgi:dTDP-4-dehydrorhamnose reductase